MPSFEELLSMPLPSAANSYTAESTDENVDLSKDSSTTANTNNQNNTNNNNNKPVVIDSGKATEAGESDSYEDERKNEDGYAEYRDDYSDGDYEENTTAECGSNCSTECGSGCGTEGCCGKECGDTPTGSLIDGMPAPSVVPVPVEVPTASGITNAEITTRDNFDVKPDDTPLTPEQNDEVDRFMDTVATPILIERCASPEEIEEFIESVESEIAVGEGLLTERTIVRFDKHAKKAQLFETAVAAVARSKNDPLYKKLQTVYKMERVIKAKLRKKYHSEADRKVKEWMARAKKSKSGFLSKLISKITGK